MPQVGPGDMVFVFDVPDADAVHAALTKAGARILEPPQTFTSRTRGPRGETPTGKVFHPWDPDGYLIELLQSPPAPSELEVWRLSGPAVR